MIAPNAASGEPRAGASSDLEWIDLALLEFSEEELLQVPQVYRALLIGISYVTNEILSLTRLLILTINGAELSRNSAPKALSAASMGVLQRALSGKIVEVIELISQTEGQNKARDAFATRLTREILSKLKGLRKDEAYKLAKAMRNRLSHHYSFRDFLSYAQLTGYKKTGMWLADTEGNSIYQIGEELTNIGFFSEYDNAEAAIVAWIDWTREASRLVAKVNGEVAIAIIEEYLPDVKAAHHRVALSSSLFADLSESVMPLFWRPFDAVGG